MFGSIFFLVIAALTNMQVLSIETKYSRIKANFFDPILSANSYTGHVKENERIVRIEPRLYASDADQPASLNGKICGYELSLHKHDDIVDDITQNIPFSFEMIDNQPTLKLKATSEALDCEIKQIHRVYVRAFDCAPGDNRRYSERSSLIITVDDVNEYAPVFTHDHYLFKLHGSQICDSSSCRVEATDDDCANQDHRVCGYEIVTPKVPFSIDSKGIISITETLSGDQYEFDVIAIDCFPSNDNSKKISQPARVTVKIIKSCKPNLNDKASEKLLIQSDRIHLFDTVNVNACEETCNVQDIVGTVELDSNGLDSGCKLDQCSTTEREYILLPKDDKPNEIPQSRVVTFNGFSQALIVNQSEFSGHLNKELTIRMWMKHANENKNDNNKQHIFCKSDKKSKNRHHTALFIQNDYLKLLLRKGPVSSDLNAMHTAEWMWKLSQINDNKWHSYKFIVDYPNKIDLYIDEQLIVATKENFRAVEDHPLSIIEGTNDTIFTLGACWHARASRMVQHFHGQLSGLSIEQKEELQRSSECIQDCHQYLDIPDVHHETNLEFVSNSNRSMWILRTDTTESYELLLKHVVYRNTFEPVGPQGERKVTIRTRVKCLGETNPNELPVFTRFISIDEPKIPIKVELKGDTYYTVPENVIHRGIYLFRTLSIFTNAIKKQQADISDCMLQAIPSLSNTEQLIIPDAPNLEKQVTNEGATFSGLETIDVYQSLFRQIAYVSHAPITYMDRSFALSCVSVSARVITNEIRVRVHIEKQMAPSAPVAAALSNQFFVDNDHARNHIVNVDETNERVKRNISDWPIAVVICVSVGLAGVLVLYLVVRIRTTNRKHNPNTNNGDDIHSQMEWEDDIGLNITVNPLDETKKSAQSVNIHNIEQTLDEYPGSSSDDEDAEFQTNNRNEYSSEDDGDDENNKVHKKKVDHQLEWDDAAIGYGPKKV
ncbi:unnamed protein product [Rotaria magnacalcarata]|uniref:Cadherin domain-containing protein n=12 Tax=Rotaria magnacalcarata TaxID=392030 RepID=A0A816SSQ0_9BILA|nr:unnamed protein product [Rotaria magnacalcarata]CAF1671480.1 unnamed protein product [Rotaria magnacalcarata]CAF2092352.1 unnamed protein product [Rotaria magnacalcarata]